TLGQQFRMNTRRRCVLGIGMAGCNAYPEPKSVCDTPTIRKRQGHVATTAREDIRRSREASVVVDELPVRSFLINPQIHILQFVFPAPAKVRPIARSGIVTADQTHRESGCSNGKVFLNEVQPAKSQLGVERKPDFGSGRGRYGATPDFELQNINPVGKLSKIKRAKQVVTRFASDSSQPGERA